MYGYKRKRFHDQNRPEGTQLGNKENIVGNSESVLYVHAVGEDTGGGKIGTCREEDTGGKDGGHAGGENTVEKTSGGEMG